MNGMIYEAAVWHDIENNREHLKREGEHYVADTMLFRENMDLRQENEILRQERDRLRKEIDRLVMNSTPTASELRRVRAEWKKDSEENARLRSLVQYIVDECYGDEWFFKQAESLGINPAY